ncbi:MAG: DNA topoisomerase III [Oscillospiraceae bacterium]|nr:DNA topoisomerase III [Oscillospiraceae bacterium]
MGKSLVLAEKPSVGREIARVLGCRQNADGYIGGDKYVVTWALGHLVTLAEPESYNKEYKTWKLDYLPMLPKKMQLVVIKNTSKQYNIVQGLIRRNDIDDIIIATDAGREGELVARWILLKAGNKKPIKRLWISSQTEKAVREGFAKLQPGGNYNNLYLSAQARAEADWLVGLNVTRALTCKHNAQLSAGRVQTPTLAMIVAREQDIKSFVPKEYYNVRAKLQGFNALWKDSKGQSRIFDKDKAEALLAACSGKEAIATEVSKQYKQKPPPAAYDLTELQRDANKKYAYSAKQTLSIMQSLYEYHKLLTYPRTDSRYVTDDIVSTLPDRLRGIAVGQYRDLAAALLKARPLSTRYLVDNNKVSDHHAIIPTEEQANLSALSPEERNVYDLVVRRFLAVLSPAYEYEEVKLTVTIGKEKFHARGQSVTSPGWRQAYERDLLDDDDAEQDSDEQDQMLPQIRQGDKLELKSCEITTGKTKPPSRYNEATLLTAMENPSDSTMSSELRSVLKTTSGLGTPATRADIIEKLFSSFYVERRWKEIVPTSKGIQVVNLAPEDLKSATLTAKWEQELALISKGESKSDDFINQMHNYTKKLVSDVVRSEAKYTHDNMTKEKCPDCGGFLLDVNSKNGKMRVCADRDCGYRKSVSTQTNARCPNCNKKLELRGEDEKRTFYCVCGHRERLSDYEKRRATAGATKNDVRDYMASQSRQNVSSGNSSLADALAKWQEANTDD